MVVAIDHATGEPLWETTLFTAGKGEIHYTNTRAAPTPLTDGEHVFVNFDNILAALDYEGQVLWQENVDPEYYRHSHYGVSTSPILLGDFLILQQDREESDDQDVGWITAFDKNTGERIWRDEWTHTCCSYTTPIVLDRGEAGLELVISTSKEIVFYDPETGEKLRTAPHPSIQPVPSLLTTGDLLAAPGGVHDSGLIVYRLGTDEAGNPTETELWQTTRAVSEITTPIFYADRLFVLKDNGILTAYNPDKGKKLWAGRLTGGNYWPSMVAGDGKLYATNQYGVVSVISAEGRRFELLAENAVGEGIHGATPAIAGGCLLLRTKNHLYCIEKGEEESAATGENADTGS